MTENTPPKTTEYAASSDGMPERRAVSDHDVYFNSKFDAEPIYVAPGQSGCSFEKDDMFVATVGSGVLVSIFDQELKIGALGYVILPEIMLESFPFLDKIDSAIIDKAFHPIESCIGEMKRRGAGKARIRVRLYGGLNRDDDAQECGLKNTVFVQEYLSRKGLYVYNADIGGSFIRRVHFFPATGRAVRCVLNRKEDFQKVASLEDDFNMSIISPKQAD